MSRTLNEGVIVPTALYGADSWGMRIVERRKVNVLETVFENWLEYHEWTELGMKRCIGELK